MTRRMFFGIATALALLSPASAQTRHEEVIYGHKMGVALSMDVTLPEKSKSNGIGVLCRASCNYVVCRSRHRRCRYGLVNYH